MDPLLHRAAAPRLRADSLDRLPSAFTPHSRVLDFPAHERRLFLARKYPASFSMFLTRGLTITPLAIFRMVDQGTSAPEATLRQAPLDFSSSCKTNPWRDFSAYADWDVITSKSTPINGRLQSINARKNSVHCPAMGRSNKMVSKQNRDARAQLGRNLERLIEREFPGTSKNHAFEQIERATGSSPSTLKRMIAGHSGPSIDTLSNLAHFLGCTVADLVGAPHKPDEPRRSRPEPRPGTRQN